MPSSLRFDPPAKKPDVEDYTDGESFERAMDDWADAEAKRKPGVFIKKFRGSRDGDDRAVHATNIRGEDNYQLITRKTGDSGKDNSAFRNRVEDMVGEETDDNALAVAEGERAQMRAEEGMTYINDLAKSIELNARLGLGPIFQLVRPAGQIEPTHMVRGFMDVVNEEAVMQICEVSHWSSAEDTYIPDPSTMVEHRRGLSRSDWVVPLRSSDRIILAT